MSEQFGTLNLCRVCVQHTADLSAYSLSRVLCISAVYRSRLVRAALRRGALYISLSVLKVSRHSCCELLVYVIMFAERWVDGEKGEGLSRLECVWIKAAKCVCDAAGRSWNFDGNISLVQGEVCSSLGVEVKIWWIWGRNVWFNLTRRGSHMWVTDFQQNLGITVFWYQNMKHVFLRGNVLS